MLLLKDNFNLTENIARMSIQKEGTSQYVFQTSKNAND